MLFGTYWALSLLTILTLMSQVRCTTVPTLDKKTYYKRDMELTVNDRQAKGVIVSPKADRYAITVSSFDDMDLLQVSSCARDVDVLGPIKPDSIFGSWTKQKRTYSFVYEPGRVEKESGCPLKLSGYNKSEGQHSWAFIEFEDKSLFELEAGLACNGAPDLRTSGVSVCQTLENLIEQIWFAAPVMLSAKVLDRCKIAAPEDHRHWQFETKPLECIYDFMEMQKPYRRHRLTTIGYQSVPIRSNP